MLDYRKGELEHALHALHVGKFFEFILTHFLCFDLLKFLKWFSHFKNLNDLFNGDLVALAIDNDHIEASFQLNAVNSG